MPFVDKGNRVAERTLEPKSMSEAPDPNVPLHAKARPAEGGSPGAAAGASGAPSLAVAPPSAPIVASVPSSVAPGPAP